MATAQRPTRCCRWFTRSFGRRPNSSFVANDRVTRFRRRRSCTRRTSGSSGRDKCHGEIASTFTSRPPRRCDACSSITPAKAASIRGGPDCASCRRQPRQPARSGKRNRIRRILILDEAITRLEGVDPDAAAVVRLRYFGGLSLDDTAAALDVSAPTVKRAWAFARGWLKEAIESERF